jgi:hypothetical protein
MIECDGVPRPMKMRTIALPWRYDAAVAHTIHALRSCIATIPI